MKDTYSFDGKKAIYTIYYQNLKFEGIAYCHPEDEDMCNEKTGLTIAHMRAQIKFLQHYKDNNLRPRLSALEHLHNCIKQSKKNYNPKNNETKLLWRQIQIIKEQLAVANNELALLRKNLKEYITNKDKFYKMVRTREKLAY